MKGYFIKTPWWLKKIYGDYTWNKPRTDKVIYLTFDDGPHPEITPFVLDELRRVNAKGTFFCIGKNVVEHGTVYRRILEEGHSVGNHTMNHPNGWKTDNRLYMENVGEASRYIDSNLFRPPYGRITRFQAANLPAAMRQKQVQVIMWDVLSADFDISLEPQTCLQHIRRNYRPGSIVVMHDSEKAYPRLRVFLPRLLDELVIKGYRMEKL